MPPMLHPDNGSPRLPAGEIRRAAALVELLVVITIILVLMGLILAALAASRRRAQEGVEISNLHQLSLAGMMYHEQNGDWPLSVAPVVAAGLAPSNVATSPLDDTKTGIANELARMTQKECPACDVIATPYRRTFLGPQDYGHVGDKFKSEIESVPGAGWLVSLTLSEPARSAVPADRWNDPIGAYLRVLLTGGVVRRVHQRLQMADGKLYTMQFMFADGDEAWRRKISGL